MIIISYLFGVCSPNPNGEASYTCTVQIPKETVDLIGMARIRFVENKINGNFDGKALSWQVYLGKGQGMTNNRSTYEALFGLLLRLNGLGLRFHSHRIYTDSLMMANQLNGTYKVSSGAYKQAYENAVAMMRVFPRASIIWIPKDRNLAREISTNIWLKNSL